MEEGDSKLTFRITLRGVTSRRVREKRGVTMGVVVKL